MGSSRRSKHTAEASVSVFARLQQPPTPPNPMPQPLTILGHNDLRSEITIHSFDVAGQN